MEPATKRRKNESGEEDEDDEDDVIEHASVPQEDVDIGSIKDKLSKKKQNKKSKETKDIIVESVADEELGGDSELLCCVLNLHPRLL